MKTNRLSRQLAAVMLLVVAVYPFCQAEVYLLGPKRHSAAEGGKGLPEQEFQELFDHKMLLEEPIVYNGVKTTLHVLLIKRAPEELLAELRQRYPALKMRADSAGVVLFWPGARGWRQRVLLVGNVEQRNVTCFIMRLPEKTPDKPQWPRTLPLPPGATPEETILFENSGVSYGAFRGSLPLAEALAAVAEKLAAEGFTPVTGEAAGTNAVARGELFLRSNPRQLLWIAFDDNGNGTLSLTPLK